MFIIFLITFLLLVYWQLATKRPKRYPPGPKWSPIIGNTLTFRKALKEYGSQIAVFQAWKEKYQSDLIGLKLGSEFVVLASGYPVIHEICRNEVFDGRPDNFFLRLRTMGSRLGITCTDGPLWSEQRSFVLQHLRRSGYGRNAMEEEIQSELSELLEVIAEYDEKPAYPGSFLPLSVINVLWIFVAGKKMSRCDAQIERLLELLEKRGRAFDMSGGWLNTMPFLRFIAPEKTSYNLMKQFNTEIYNFFMPIIEDHKKKFSADKVDENLIFAFINEMRKQDNGTNFTDTQLVMVILDLFIAGAQSTSFTIQFTLMNLALNPDVQSMCHNIIDKELGTDQLPMLQDRSKLAFIEAVILETQRIANVAPLSGPHRVLKDTVLNGYVLPKNTTILMGLETVNMDADYWGDPEVFRPQRFLDADNKIVNTERVVPFGQGRRRCLGEILARACIFSYTVGILQKYRIEVPEKGRIPEGKKKFGLLTSPEPFDIIFRNRMNKSAGLNQIQTDNIHSR